MDPIELGIFASRLEAVCNEMGAVLHNVAFSPNIRDRLDFPCAVFDHTGGLCAQAAHIPVHLGSMAFAMASVVAGVPWSLGDMLILNDPAPITRVSGPAPPAPCPSLARSVKRAKSSRRFT